MSTLRHPAYRMKRSFQAISRGILAFPALLSLLAITLSAHAPAEDSPLQRNIILLIDQSMSVDDANRQSALTLISGLVGGEVSPESRNHWRFTSADRPADAPGAEETANLTKLFSAQESALPIARATPLHLMGGLGNYSRTGDLRTKLSGGLDRSSRADLASRIAASSADYPAVDVSTHVILAESVLARTLLQSSSTAGDYYLIVISDFFEDCFNRPVSDYTTPNSPVIASGREKLTLTAANALVHEGKLPFNDGAGRTGAYNADDQAAIRYFREKVEQLQLGEFTYSGPPVTGGNKLPVQIRIYAHSPKRNLAFGLSSYTWTFPSAAPEITWTAEGVSPGSLLTLVIAGETSRFEATQANAEGTPFTQDLSRHFKQPLAPGEHDITLSISDPRSPRALEARSKLTFVVPGVAFTGKFASSSSNSPLELDNRSEILTERFDGKLDPPPGSKSSVAVTLEAKNKAIRSEPTPIPVEADGTFSLALRDFPREIVDQIESGDTYQLTAALPDPGEILSPGDRPSASCFFLIPKINLWPEGYPEDTVIALKTDGIRFKSSHAGIPGYQWRSPQITGKDGELATTHYTVGQHRNTITFSRSAPAGTYRVVMRIAHEGEVVQENAFTIEIPSKTPWMLIALGTMALFSIGLASWYAFTRR